MGSFLRVDLGMRTSVMVMNISDGSQLDGGDSPRSGDWVLLTSGDIVLRKAQRCSLGNRICRSHPCKCRTLEEVVALDVLPWHWDQSHYQKECPC